MSLIKRGGQNLRPKIDGIERSRQVIRMKVIVMLKLASIRKMGVVGEANLLGRAMSRPRIQRRIHRGIEVS